MTWRSEIITCIRTNTAIPQFSEQLSFSLLQQIDSHPYQLLTFQSVLFDCVQVVFWFLFFVMSPQHLAFAPSVSVFPHLPPKDTAVSGIRPGCGLVLAGQWAMQAFFPPAVGSWVEYLPSDVFCWAPFTHTTDCKWCSGLSPVDLEGDQIHHCPRRTLRRPDIHWFCHQKNPSARC